MDQTEKNKLKHDFSNSIVIINNMSKSAANFIKKISASLHETECAALINQKQLTIFLNSMEVIRKETSKIEKLFEINCA